MFVEFSVENFKSIKDRQYLLLEADAIGTKTANTFGVKAPRKFQLLKSLVIYGANASGKTNVIAAISNMHDFILNSTDLKNGQLIKWYLPFKFDKRTRHAATQFSVKFIGPESVLYHYEFCYDQHEIIFESLDFYPRGYKANLFRREQGELAKLGNHFSDKKIDRRILKNQLFLSKMGNSGHDQMGAVYMYFRTMMLWSIPAKSQLKYLMEKTQKMYIDEQGQHFRQKLNSLMRVADTKIEGVVVSKREFTADEFGFLEDEREFTRYRTLAIHKIYDNGEEVGTEAIDIKEESVGTQVLFALGGMILNKLNHGGVLVIDEMDNSLHPQLSKFLVELFHNPESNPHNAQLIFATHETALLEGGVFRNDQVCIVQKNDKGASEVINSTQFDELKADVSLYQYYMRGQMGGQPRIREVEFIYGNDL
ncbi:MAG: hypothetical protein RIS47_1330 [Bacteroidota bacterium]|jgi:AAA15 family ATPase/GTPase